LPKRIIYAFLTLSLAGTWKKFWILGGLTSVVEERSVIELHPFIKNPLKSTAESLSKFYETLAQPEKQHYYYSVRLVNRLAEVLGKNFKKLDKH